MNQFDKGHPVPAEWQRIRWKEMEIGDSFYVADKAAADRAWTAARVTAARSPMRFRQQRDEHGGRRIWRIS